LLGRTLGAVALAAVVLAGCNKTADKAKTTDQFVSDGFTKDQATCITDTLWAKIPKKDLDGLTDPKAVPTDEQATIVGQAVVTCGKDTLIDQMKGQFAAADASMTPAQIDCIIGKLTDADLLDFVNGKQDAVVTATTACTSGS
jgi:hypothetical protein